MQSIPPLERGTAHAVLSAALLHAEHVNTEKVRTTRNIPTTNKYFSPQINTRSIAVTMAQSHHGT